MNKLPIVFSVDDNYVLPLCVTIQSLKNNCNSNLDICVFYDDLLQTNIELLTNLKTEKCDINFISIKNELAQYQLKTIGRFPVSVFFRLFAPKFLKEYSKILYLDCDLMVLGDISNLFNEDLGECVLAGVKDKYINDNESINSGVILFNTAKFLEQSICEKCLTYAQNTPTLVWPDQQAINYICKGKIKLLSVEYNFAPNYVLTPYVLSYKELKTTPKIVHCIGHNKAWMYSQYPFSKDWWEMVKTLPEEIQGLVMDKYGFKISNQNFNIKLYACTKGNMFQKGVFLCYKIAYNISKFFKKIKIKK